MALPTLNLNQIIEQIEWADVSERFRNNPESVTPAEHAKFQGWGLWNQSVWAQQTSKNVCGTSYCQAGEAVVRAGYRIVWRDNDPENHSTACRKGSRGQIVDIGEVATGVLGLTREEADLYFDGDNNLDDLRFYANAFAYRRGLSLPYEDGDFHLNSALDMGFDRISDVLDFLGEAEPARV